MWKMYTSNQWIVSIFGGGQSNEWARFWGEF